MDINCFIDGSAPPFIILSLCFVLMAFMLTFFSTISQDQPIQSRYFKHSKIWFGLLKWGVFFLVALILARIITMGLYKISGRDPSMLFVKFDVFILMNLAFCFSFSFICINLYVRHITSYTLLNPIKASEHQNRKRVYGGGLIGKINWTPPKSGKDKRGQNQAGG